MERSNNTRPLLQHSSETDSDFEDDLQEERTDIDNDLIVVTKDTKPLFKAREPVDRYNAGYIAFYLLGTTALLPWFFFITAEEYWMFKLRNLNESSSVPDIDDRSELQTCFTSYISIASTVPSTVFLIINPLVGRRISVKLRMITTLAFMLVLFIITTVLVKVDTDTWQNGFFILTLTIVVLLNIASAIFQSGLFGIVGRFPSPYITATVSGQALGGILAAVAEIASLWVGASPLLSAFVYFIIADSFLLISIFAYILLSQTVFFKYYMCDGAVVSGSGSVQYEPVASPSKVESPIVRHICYLSILKKIWVYGMSVWLCFFITLGLYPAVTGLINSGEINSSPWTVIYFIPVVAYLLFSITDYTGRLLAGYLQWPEDNSLLVALLSIVRVVFIPLLMVCNAQPRHHIPVLIYNDYVYITIILFFGLTNGYLANITMITVPKIVHPHEQETASSMMAAFLGIGLAFGSLLGLLLVELL
ncbi:equilibrative nucleoside transporter 1 [Lycorma delicatula]|uniref:equilibrative nucleoside transporter 1 n=1 Tax=Lycorma delicatula TaxID=130591 RepID=UPI003F51719A